MKIEILYKNGELEKGMDMPTFVDKKHFWYYETKNRFSGKAAKEAIDAFYKWANKEKLGVVILSLTFLDWV